MYCCDAPKTPTHNTAYLAARVAMLRNTDPEVDEPSVLVSVAVVVVDPAGITRSTTASLVHSAVLRRNDAYTIGPEAMACGGVGALATDTWLPTGAVERWARTVIDGAVWCGTESQSSWRWSRSPSSTPSDVTWTATPQPTVLFHQSGLCFCQGANRWRVTATSDYNGYASRCADAARAAHPEYAKPVTSVVLVDFDDDAFSHASFFGGREYSSISHFAQVYGLPKYTSPGEEYRHTCSQSHDTLIGAARQPADDWLQVTSPSLLSRFIGLSFDETSQALSNMERAALTDAQCMHQLVAAMADQAVVAEYAHTPNPFTRRHLCTPAMQSFAKRTLSSPFRNTPSTAVGKCLRRSGDNDSDDTEWARQ